MVIMPSSWEVAMILSIWWILDSRIRFRIALLKNITSKAGTTPPSTFGISCWETTACMTMESCARTCSCCAGGKLSMIRSMVLAAPTVCRVEMTR